MKNSKEDKEISAITVKIKKSDWENFKSTVPRSLTLNEAVVELINQHYNSKLKKALMKNSAEV
jgi:hypothetical protein